MRLRRVALCLLIAGMAGLGGTASQAASVVVEVGIAPPPPRVVAVPPPRYGYVWVPGYWRWSGHHHVWVKGYWVRERPGYHWIPAHWTHVGPRWQFVPGHWVR